MEKQSRRGLLKNAASAAAGVAGAAMFAAPDAKAQGPVVWKKKAVTVPTVAGPTGVPVPAPKVPLYSPAIVFGNLVFVSGIGAHFPGTIEEHTKHVLDEIERTLVAAGSSMDKVLKVNVFLSDMTNFARMNTMYAGRFGDTPPVRTTIAAVVPGGDALVEIECIASL